MTNCYYRFIKILKRKENKGFSPNTVLHKHHIDWKIIGQLEF
jgi:hypothetical protein